MWYVRANRHVGSSQAAYVTLENTAIRQLHGDVNGAIVHFSKMYSWLNSASTHKPVGKNCWNVYSNNSKHMNL